MKSSSYSCAVFGRAFGSSSSSSSSTLNNESYDLAAFSASLARANSALAFSCATTCHPSEEEKCHKGEFTYLLNSSSPACSILALDSIDPFLLMINLALDLCLG